MHFPAECSARLVEQTLFVDLLRDYAALAAFTVPVTAVAIARFRKTL